ncbi:MULTISPECIES: hypothetical protein [Pseudomonas]|uniref:hypothetical protein n=1 Tax=Pseudomonas TaxID=286 RepID=UPI000641C408|nr:MULTISPECIES: hypothetical protein [Pseudomonas]NMZ57015.1 hypothetical protein [Pseudomonas lundensis]NNA13176.1 hypothetical protein [Pseudomonas lundensis]QOF92110.1 hypothetical protein IF654_02675 [Pseudomonas lundensis]SDQ82507.1 hypothetical protein SAMN04490192_3539 [Pseudomonas lundensis]
MVDIYPQPIINSLDPENVLDLVALGTADLQTYVWYEGIKEGDTVWPNWRGCSASGEVLDLDRSGVDVEGDFSKGMPVSVPNNLLVPLDQGWAFYSYAIQLKGEKDLEPESKRQVIYVGKRPAQRLPCAHITESNALCINIDDLPGTGASVTVLPYQAMAAGDRVTFMWQGYMDDGSHDDSVSYEYDVTLKDIGQPLTWVIEKTYFEFIEGGYGHLDYCVEYSAPSNVGVSYATQQRFVIIPSSESLLEAPTINDFDDLSGVELNPDDYKSGITVSIPLLHNARIGDDLRVYGSSSLQVLSALRTLRVDPSVLDSGRVECHFDYDWLVANNWQAVDFFYQWGRHTFSRSSNSLSLAIRQKRDLIAPMVKTAYPDGNDQFWFDAIEGSVAGIDVIIPDAAVIDITDTVNVEWAFDGTVAAYTGPSYEDKPREFNIPLEYIAPFMGKRINVAYSVTPNSTHVEGEVYYSDFFDVQVNRLPTNQFPLLKHELGGDANTLSLAAVPDAGAPFVLETWKFMAAGQRVTIQAKGGTSEPDVQEYLCREVEVHEGDVSIGRFSALLSKEFLTQLTPNTTFTISTQVSFDKGETYLPFRLLTLMLKK